MSRADTRLMVDQILDLHFSGVGLPEVRKRLGVSGHVFRKVLASEDFEEAYRERRVMVLKEIEAGQVGFIRDMFEGMRALIPSMLEAYRRGMMSENTLTAVKVAERVAERFSIGKGYSFIPEHQRQAISASEPPMTKERIFKMELAMREAAKVFSPLKEESGEQKRALVEREDDSPQQLEAPVTG